jgi:hypothetical protein
VHLGKPYALWLLRRCHVQETWATRRFSCPRSGQVWLEPAGIRKGLTLSLHPWLFEEALGAHIESIRVIVVLGVTRSYRPQVTGIFTSIPLIMYVDAKIFHRWRFDSKWMHSVCLVASYKVVLKITVLWDVALYSR